MSGEFFDLVLRIAYLEGAVDIHGAYEREVQTRVAVEPVPEASRALLIRRLENAQSLAAPVRDLPLTLGAFLRRASRTLPRGGADLARRIGVSRNLFRLLEHDRISPLKIPVESWLRFLSFFRLPAAELEVMLRRTHRLVVLQPSYRSTLARYSAGPRGRRKNQILDRAAGELYARAELSVPPDEQARLDALLTSIRRQSGCDPGKNA